MEGCSVSSREKGWARVWTVMPQAAQTCGNFLELQQQQERKGNVYTLDFISGT